MTAIDREALLAAMDMAREAYRDWPEEDDNGFDRGLAKAKDLIAAAPPVPLDVERLARAIDRVWRDDGWKPTHPNSRQSHDEAERIAREYEAQ